MNKETETVEIICAWCNKVIGAKEFPVSQNMQGEPTHSICSECFEKQLPNKESK